MNKNVVTSSNAEVLANQIIGKHCRKSVKMLSLWKVGHSLSFYWHLDISPLTFPCLYGNKLVVFLYCIMNTCWIIGIPDINLMHCDILFSVGLHCAPETQWIELGGVRTLDLGCWFMPNTNSNPISLFHHFEKLCCIFKAE